MLKKILFGMLLVFVMCFGFIFGYGIVYARIIPGWDRPWDPPNYYSLTSISWADTLNPSFFFRDLGWQGGNVYDYTRHGKSILSLNDLTSQLQVLMEQLGIKQRNSTPMDVAASEEHRANIDLIYENAIDSNESKNVLAVLEGKGFRSANRFDEQTNKYEKDRQLKELENAYAAMAKAAQKNVHARAVSEAEFNKILAEAYNARGMMEIMQADNALESLKQAELARKNALLSNLIAIEAMQQKAEADEELLRQRMIDEARVHFIDPYHPTEDEKKVYTRPAPRGFVRFNLAGN